MPQDTVPKGWQQGALREHIRLSMLENQQLAKHRLLAQPHKVDLTPRASAIQAPVLNSEPCNCRGTVPLMQEERDRILERLLNPHVFNPYGNNSGWVSEHVKDSDFECCPAHPNKASCPSGGCQHCKGGEGNG